VEAEQVERDRLTHELRTRNSRSGSSANRSARCAASVADAPHGARRWLPSSATGSRGAAQPRALAGQLRAAYLIGRQEPLKLLLNQKDPALVGRHVRLLQLLRARNRAGQIKLIEDDMQRIAELDGELAAEISSSRG